MAAETYKEEAAALRRAIQRMNNGGKHWTKGTFRKGRRKSEFSYCILGGIREEGIDIWGADTTVVDTIADVAIELYPAPPEEYGWHRDPAEFNDHPNTKWGHVKRVLQNAAKRLDKMPKETT